jgi:hypothetical protein
MAGSERGKRHHVGRAPPSTRTTVLNPARGEGTQVPWGPPWERGVGREWNTQQPDWQPGGVARQT